MDLRYASTNIRYIGHTYGAGWTGTHFVRASDMSPFGPRVAAADELADAPLALGVPKPVRYAPVKREKGKETFLPVSIELALVEPGKVQAVKVAAWEGAEVEVDVLNLWDPQHPEKVTLKGQLKGLFCALKVDADTVKSWLDPKGPLKARVNENLFDFRFRIPKIQVKGKPYTGESSNRLFFYRRKILVFFPGVFGSQVQVQAPGGQVLGFPDFSDETAPLPQTEGEAMAQLGMQLAKVAKQKIGVLECDSEGKPLAEPKDPKLFMLTVPVKGPVVYNPFNRLREARQAHHRPLPEDLKLYRLFLAPYDWRLDLTDTAEKKLEELKKIQDGEFGRKAPDSDDEIALIGHSTGGLLIRRILANPKADGLVSQAFFMNVPFRGAPKPLSVIPTGRDPLTGGSMIPFVTPHSLRAICLTAPIVYHLSASPTYPDPIFIVKKPSGVQPFTGLQAEKEWVTLAIAKGFMPGRKVIPAKASLSSDERRALAMGADDWAKYWDDRWERLRGRLLIGWARPKEVDGWEARERTKRKMDAQDAVREEQGWSDVLSDRAGAFHKKCEEMAKEGKWADRSFIFYSVAQAPTTLAVEAKLVEAKVYGNLASFLNGAGITIGQLDTDLLPPPVEEGKPEKRTDRLVEDGVLKVEHWSRPSPTAGYLRETWRFASLRNIYGDGTVPLPSLVGYGGKAKVFKKLVDEPGGVTGPEHVAAPNSAWAWERIIEVLQGHDDRVDKNLDKDVDPVRGTDPDSRLKPLQDAYLNA